MLKQRLQTCRPTLDDIAMEDVHPRDASDYSQVKGAIAEQLVRQ